MDNTYDYSALWDEIAEDVESGLTDRLNKIDFEGIIKKALSRYHLKMEDIDWDSKAFQLALSKGLYEAINGVKKQVKADLGDFDIANYMKISPDALNAKIKTTFKNMTETLKEYGKEAAQEFTDEFFQAMTVARVRKIKLPDKVKEKWEDAYNDLMDELRIGLGGKDTGEYKIGSDLDAKYTKASQTYQEWYIAIQDRIEEYKSTVEIAKKVVNTIRQTLPKNASEDQVRDVVNGLLESSGSGIAKTQQSLKELDETVKELGDEVADQHISDAYKELFEEIKKVGNVAGLDVTNEKLRKSLEELKLIGKEAENLTLVNQGYTNEGGIIGEDKVVLLRKNTEENLQNSQELMSRLEEAYKRGVNVARIIDVINDGSKVFMEVQEKMSGKTLGNHVDVINWDFLDATEEQINRFAEDIKKLQDLSVGVDINLSNIFYDKDKGFGFIDLDLQPAMYEGLEDFLHDARGGIVGEIEDECAEMNKDLDKIPLAENFFNKFAEGFKGSLDVHSPSRETAKIADNVVDGFVEEVEERLPEVEKVGEKLGDAVKDGIKNSLQGAAIDEDDIDAILGKKDIANQLGYEMKESGETAETMQEVVAHSQELTEAQRRYNEELELTQNRLETLKQDVASWDEDGIVSKYLFGDDGNVKDAEQMLAEIKSETEQVLKLFGQDYENGIKHDNADYLKALENTFRKISVGRAYGILNNDNFSNVKDYVLQSAADLFKQWKGSEWDNAFNELGDDVISAYGHIIEYQQRLNLLQQDGGQAYLDYLEEIWDLYRKIQDTKQQYATFDTELDVKSLDISQEEADNRAKSLSAQADAIEELTNKAQEFIAVHKEFRDFENSPYLQNDIQGLQTLSKMMDDQAAKFTLYTKQRRGDQVDIFTQATDYKLAKKTNYPKELEQIWENLEDKIYDGSLQGQQAIDLFDQKAKELGYTFDDTAKKWKAISDVKEEVPIVSIEEMTQAEAQMGEQGVAATEAVEEGQDELQHKIEEITKSIEKEKASLKTLENIINGNVSYKGKKEATDALRHWYNELNNQENNGRVSDKTIVTYMNIRKAAEELGVAQSSLNKYFNPIAVSQYEKALENVKGSYDVTRQSIEMLENELKELQNNGVTQAEIQMGEQGEVATEQIKEGLKEVQEEAEKTVETLQQVGDKLSIVGYHGAAKKWKGDAFDVNQTRAAQLGSGMYFVDSPEKLEGFLSRPGSGDIKKTELNLERCFMLTKDYISSIEDINKILGTTFDETTESKEVIGAIRNFTKASKANSLSFRQSMLDLGYQGLYAGDNLANKKIDNELVVYDESLLQNLETINKADFQSLLNNVDNVAQAEVQMGEQGEAATDKIHEGLKEIQEEAEKAQESIAQVYNVFRGVHKGDFFKSDQGSAWFSSSLKNASTFGANETYRATIKADNPMVVDAHGAVHDRIVWAETQKEMDEALQLQAEITKKRAEFSKKYGEYLATQDQSLLPDVKQYLAASDEIDQLEGELSKYLTTTEQLQDIAKSKGFNSLIINNIRDAFSGFGADENLSTSIAVFNEELILSKELISDVSDEINKLSQPEQALVSAEEVNAQQQLTEQIEKANAAIEEQGELQDQLYKEQGTSGYLEEELNKARQISDELKEQMDIQQKKLDLAEKERAYYEEAANNGEREITDLENQLRQKQAQDETLNKQVSELDEKNKTLTEVNQNLQKELQLEKEINAQKTSSSAKVGKKEVDNVDKLTDALRKVIDAVNEKTEAFKKEQSVVKEVVKSEVGDVAALKGAVDDVSKARKTNQQNKQQQAKNTENEKIKEVLKYYEQLEKTEQRYQYLIAKRDISNKDLSVQEAMQLQKLQMQRDLEQERLLTLKEITKEVRAAQESYKHIAEMENQNASGATRNALVKSIENQISKTQAKIDSGKYTQLSSNAVQTRLNNVKNANFDEANVEQLQTYVQLLEEMNKQFVKAGNNTKLTNLLGEVNQILADNSKLSRGLRTQFADLGTQLESALETGSSQEEVQALTRRLIELKTEMIKTGQNGKSFFGMVKNDITQASARVIATYMSFQDLIRYTRQAISAITDLNTALTQLKIVSGESDTTIKAVAQDAYNLANKLGMSTTEVVSSITEWRRLGKSIEDSMILAEQAARLSTGGLMDISSATTALTSSMQAFEMGAEDASRVVDQYIYLGNNYAITSEQLATSLTKSMAALKVAGNSLEEIEALEVAGNAMVQDADVVSNSLKVLSLRLRGTTGSALEEIGEDTEGLIEDFSKLNNKIRELTKTASNPEGVSIIDKENGRYKSTYQILLQIAKVWNEIGDMQKAEVLETIAGKTRATAAAAILESPELLMSAYTDAMTNATNAGEQAVAISMQSIEKRFNVLKNNLKQVAVETLSSDAINNVVDSLNDVIVNIKNSSSSFMSMITALSDVLSLALKVFNKAPAGGLFGLMLAKKGAFGKDNALNNFFTNGFFNIFKGGLPEALISKQDLKIIQSTVGALDDVVESHGRLRDSLVALSPEAQRYVKLQMKEEATGRQIVAGAKKQAAATKALTVVQGALNAALSIGFSLIVSQVVTQITKLVHAEENFAQATKDFASSIESTESDIDSYKEQIMELQKTISSEESSVEDVITAKNNLYNIQDKLIEQFGDMANGVDLITAAINGEIAALDELKRENWEEELAKFNADEDNKLWSLDDVFIPIVKQFAGGETAAKLLAPNYDKSSAEIAYEKWLRGDMEHNAFAKKYFEREVLAKQYTETYNALKALDREYNQALRSVEGVTAEQMQDFADRYVGLINQFTDVGQEKISSVFTSLAQNVKSNNTRLENDAKFRAELESKVTDLYHSMISGVFTKNGSLLSADELEDTGWLRDNIIDYLGINSTENYDLLRQAIIAVEQEVADAFAETGVFEPYKWESVVDKYYEMLGVTEDVIKSSYKTWLASNSSLMSDADKKEYYKTSDLISAYSSSVSPFKDILKNFEQGSTSVNFGDLATQLDTTELFTQLGMDSFQSYINGFEEDAEILKGLGEEEAQQYIEGFGETSEALGAYLTDVLRKTLGNLDLKSLSAEEYSLFTDTLYGINSELFTVSESVMKIEDSYWELKDVQKKISEGASFNQEEALALMTKYQELASGVAEKYEEVDEASGKIITKYKFHQSAIDSLVESYATMSNEAITSMNDMGLYAEETIKWLKEMEREILQMTLDMMEFSTSADTLIKLYEKRDNSLHNAISGLSIEDQRKITTIFDKTSQRLNELSIASKLDLKENKDDDDNGNKDKDKDNKSRLDWLEQYLEKRNRLVEEKNRELDNLPKVDILANDADAINKQLEKLQKGGNVNLKLRPEIDTKLLKEKDWEDVGDGFATVFSSVYSNEAGNLAMNFTPIIVDPVTGEFDRVLTPDELQKYAEEVIAGVREDDLNLQIGAAFTGEDAIDQAIKAGKKIHKLHEQLSEISNDIESDYYDQRKAAMDEYNESLEQQLYAYRVAEKEYTDRMSSGVLFDNLVKAAGSQKAAQKLVNKIMAGESINLEEMESDLQSAISEMVTNWNNKRDAAEKQIEIGVQIKENNLAQMKEDVERVVNKYDRILKEYEQRQKELEHYQTMQTTEGLMQNEQYIIALIDNESKALADNIKKRDTLTAELKSFIPTTENELLHWYDLKNQIDETTSAIYENQEAIASWQNEVKKLEWELDDKIMEMKYAVTDEAEFLMNNLDNSDMYKYIREFLGNDAVKTKLYNGDMSDEGLATLAMRFTKRKAYYEQIKEYDKQIAEAQALYEKDTANTENLDRLNDLIKRQREVVNNYNDEKQAILDLVREGYDKQLESLQSLIDKYMEALNAEKD